MDDTLNKSQLRPMVRDNYMLPWQIREPLHALAEKTGRPKSEIVREALSRYLMEEQAAGTSNT